MKTIKIVHVIFDTVIAPFELPAFRGAVAKKTGPGNILFHNHLDDNNLLYRYPLIQYKCIRNNPAIYCIEYGVDEIHKFFEKPNWNLYFSEKEHVITIKKLLMNQYTLQVSERMFHYRIENWVGLNQINFETYRNIPGLKEKITFLENILTANILSMAKSVDWTVDKEIQLNILEITRERKAKIKNTLHLGMDIVFTTNVFLPDYIGLGKRVSLGFGMVRPQHHHTSEH